MSLEDQAMATAILNNSELPLDFVPKSSVEKALVEKLKCYIEKEHPDSIETMKLDSYDEGYSEGYDSGYDEGYASGRSEK